MTYFLIAKFSIVKEQDCKELTKLNKPRWENELQANNYHLLHSARNQKKHKIESNAYHKITKNELGRRENKHFIANFSVFEV